MAVSVTTVPLAKLAVQRLPLVPQLIPAGALVTMPCMGPAMVTASVADGARANVAVIVVAEVSVTLQVPVPLHPPPLQPVNTDPAAALAVSVTTVPPG